MQVREVIRRHPKLFHWRRGAFVLLGLLVIVLALLALRWPFTRAATIRSLEQISLSNVRIGRFEKLFFPHPGYIAEGVTFTRGDTANTPPLAKIEKLSCHASWFSLISFTHRIMRMDLGGLQMHIPAQVPPAVRKYPRAKIQTTVTNLYANGAVLEVAPRQGGAQAIRFDFPELTLHNLARNKAIPFRTRVLNANTIGELAATGSVGPLRLASVGEMQISGDYHIRHDDLSVHKVVAGTLAADGRFSGTLGRAQIAGQAEIPDFEITSSHHALGVTAEYHLNVDATRGDIAVQSAEAHFLHTTLVARGSISGQGSKTLALDVEGRDTRVEDLLRLIVQANRPPLEGAMTLHAHVVLPPRHERFLRRVQLRGDFSIAGAEFTNALTEAKLDELSTRARGGKAKTGEHSRRVAAELKSDVNIDGGVARLSEAVFTVPGAVARGTGSYNLLNEGIDLHGKLAMEASLSKAAGGIKSVALLPLDPFFKKNGAGALVPVSITGTYSHPVFRVLFTK